ncbi:uncharacterized protein C11orf24-like, partial [Gracilinanus agilis]|uniref:uncharacterized protein C11orf24-like n=1 Tax=Gracilinanus agilis TaxID=191870 RepID=UPI001CFD4783
SSPACYNGGQNFSTPQSQMQGITEKTSMTTKTAKNPGLIANKNPVHLSLQTKSHPKHDHLHFRDATARTGVPSPEAVRNLTIQGLPVYSEINPASSLQKPARGEPTDAPRKPEIPRTLPTPIPVVSVEPPSKPLAISGKAPPASRGTDPKTALVTAKPSTSQVTERSVFQGPGRPKTVTISAGSSRSSSQTSVHSAAESEYIRLSASPLRQYWANQNLLFAALLICAIFFISVLVLLAMQAYESYKNRGYTHVNYLINGMYVDSEI